MPTNDRNMKTKEPTSLDILGIKPVGEALKTVTEGAVNGAAAFLGRICLPAAKEGGLIIADIGSLGSDFLKNDGRFSRTLEELQEITAENDPHRLDCELDHLREIGLLVEHCGFPSDSTELKALVIPSSLALQMYVR